MSNLYLTPAERYTAALGGFYYGDLPEPGTVYTQLIKDILDGSTPDKVPKNILARFIYSLYISDLGDPYPRYELAKLLYWKLHDITPTKSGSILTVTIDGKEDYMTINTDLSRLWYKVLFGSKIDVITEFPYIFNTMQNKLSDWELFGNVEVSGTPTPDNPVMPQGTGERTGNLFDGVIYEGFYNDNGQLVIDPSHAYHTNLIKADTQTAYTVSNLWISSPYFAVYEWDTNKQWLRRIHRQVPTGNKITFTLSNDCVYFSLQINSNYDYTRLMLNTGSTALPYEPYGYKITISSANTTTPVYLGEVETTRKIRKYELTGLEDWRLSSSISGAFWCNNFNNDYDNSLYNIVSTFCTHYKSVANQNGFTNLSDRSVCLYCYKTQTNYHELYIKDTSQNTLEDFKTFLATQYAAGTPVTVWYVLATPETAVVNEPLMKIGEYVDSMSRTQTGIDIPTVVGQNTLDVLTTVKPSYMSIEYTSAEENQSRSKRISLLKSPLKKGLIK